MASILYNPVKIIKVMPALQNLGNIMLLIKSSFALCQVLMISFGLLLYLINLIGSPIKDYLLCYNSSYPNEFNNEGNLGMFKYINE